MDENSSCVPHLRQEETWDCGLASVKMVLRAAWHPKKGTPLPTNKDLLSIIKTKSIWTIDLANALKHFHVPFVFYTISTNVNKSTYNSMPFYSGIANDEDRVNQSFEDARKNGIQIVQRSLSAKELSGILRGEINMTASPVPVPSSASSESGRSATALDANASQGEASPAPAPAPAPAKPKGDQAQAKPKGDQAQAEPKGDQAQAKGDDPRPALQPAARDNEAAPSQAKRCGSALSDSEDTLLDGDSSTSREGSRGEATCVRRCAIVLVDITIMVPYVRGEPKGSQRNYGEWFLQALQNKIKSTITPTARPSYSGHYIVLIGHDAEADEYVYRDPASQLDVCYVDGSVLEKARKAVGTDEDILFIDLHERAQGHSAI